MACCLSSRAPDQERKTDAETHTSSLFNESRDMREKQGVTGVPRGQNLSQHSGLKRRCLEAAKRDLAKLFPSGFTFHFQLFHQGNLYPGAYIADRRGYKYCFACLLSSERIILYQGTILPHYSKYLVSANLRTSPVLSPSVGCPLKAPFLKLCKLSLREKDIPSEVIRS